METINFKMRIQIYIIAALTFWLSSCITDDIPYRYIPGQIEEIAVKGQTGEAVIDYNKLTVQLTVDDQVELENIPVTKLVVNAESTIFPDEAACINPNKFPSFSFTSLDDLPSNANTALNFTKPVKVLLQTYQDYWWTITVNQVIDRTISVDNQVGSPIFDLENKIAVVYVSENQTLNKVKINELNLEGPNSTLIPDPATVQDFTRPQQFAVSRNGRFIGNWTVDIVHTEVTATTGSAEVWAKKAYVKGGMKSGATPSVEYKKSTDSNWTLLDQSAITILTSTTFKATIAGLEDGVSYRWRVIAENKTSDPSSFTTEKIQEIPNLNFDTWVQNGKNWYPNPVANNFDAIGAYWATGNEGVTSALAGSKDPISIPVTGAEAYKGTAAKLTSITGVSLVGAAAGNLFIGTYKTNAAKPSASVVFGRPFTGARPTKLKGYYKYTPASISNGGTVPATPLRNDQCNIYLKIWDTDGNEFAFGEFIGKEKVTTYTEFSFDIKYSNLSARPAKIMILATSSQYGGEFDGAKVIGQVGHGSTLWVDEFELVYD